MTALRSALADASSGTGSIVMLAGEPGIGKTRTAEELARVSRQEGFGVLWGRSHEAEGAPPFWPWIQAIRDHLGRNRVHELPPLVGLGSVHVDNRDPAFSRNRAPGQVLIR